MNTTYTVKHIQKGLFIMIFAFEGSTRRLRRSSEGAGASRRLSGWCGYDWRDSLYLGLVSAEAKAVGLGVRS